MIFWIYLVIVILVLIYALILFPPTGGLLWPFFLLLFVLLIYSFIVLLGIIQQNPSPSTDSNITTKESTITFTELGSRGDMGNQIFQIACLLATAKKNKCRYVVPDSYKKLPFTELFDLSSLPVKNIHPERTIFEFDN